MTRWLERHRNWSSRLLGLTLLAPWCLSSLVSQDLSSTVATKETVLKALDAGAYEIAEATAERWCARVADQDGSGSVEHTLALDLLVEAQIKNGRAGSAATPVLAERIVHLKEQYFGANHVATSVSVHNLGVVRTHRGEFAAAISLHERGLQIRLAALGPDDQQVADSLDLLALALIRLERFQEASRKLDESQRIRESQPVHSPLPLARTLELVGQLHRYSGSYTAAVAPLERALAIQRGLASEHPDMLTLLQVRGDVRFLMGDIRGAQQAWLSAVQLGERVLRTDHPAMSELLRRQGLAAFSLGNLSEARALREKALRIGEVSLAPCDPAVTALFTGVANSSRLDGDYARARRLYRRILSTIEDCARRNQTSAATGAYATAIYNEAAVANEIGDLAQADALYQRAIQVWSSAFEPDHPFVARGLDALADVAASRGQLERAHLLYGRALTIRRKKVGQQHPDVAWTLTNLAQTSADSGRLTLAAGYVAEALEIFKRTGPSDEPDHFARVLALRGDIEIRRGDYLSARTSFAEAVSTREQIFGASHPLVADSQARLAAADLALGSQDAALARALNAERAGRDHLQFTVRYLPERQAMAYAAKRPRALDLALSIVASESAAAPRSVFNAVIQSRGVILDELVAREKARSGSGPETASLNATAIQARQRYANLIVRSLQEQVPRAMLDEARQQKEDAEQALAESSVDARTEMRRADISFNDVDEALPYNAVLVSFVLYDRTRIPVKEHRPISYKPMPSYGAFVLRAGASEVAFIPLGTAAWIDGLIKAWRIEAGGGSIVSGHSASQASIAYRTAGAALRRAVWDPLNARVAGAARTFIVPDGLLNIVNVAALPDRNGHYLVEGASSIHYLSTERDLVMTAGQPPGRGLFAVGGPAFGQVATKSAAITPALRSGCDGFGDMHFEDLPGSRREVVEISKFWPSEGGDDAKVLSGATATETAVKQNLGGHRMVHLATHGFFLGTDCSFGVAGTRSVGGLAKKAPPKKASAVAENPLSLAGLAFAGANRRRSVRGDLDDGILTAEEIGGLNLQGVEWAVLSACDTGLGEIKAGEGVFGLRRAFQVAGARTVIMSLWSVEDRSAMQWMRALYEGRLRRGLDTADAVRAASLAVLAERRARGQSTHPFFWAGFVAAGDWR